MCEKYMTLPYSETAVSKASTSTATIFTATSTETLTPTITLTPTETLIPTETLTPTITLTPAQSPTPTPLPAGLSDWLIYDGIKVGVADISFNRYLGYFSTDQGKTYVSIYLVAHNASSEEHTILDYYIELVDERGEITSGVLFGEK